MKRKNDNIKPQCYYCKTTKNVNDKTTEHIIFQGKIRPVTVYCCETCLKKKLEGKRND